MLSLSRQALSIWHLYNDATGRLSAWMIDSGCSEKLNSPDYQPGDATKTKQSLENCKVSYKNIII